MCGNLVWVRWAACGCERAWTGLPCQKRRRFLFGGRDREEGDWSCGIGGGLVVGHQVLRGKCPYCVLQDAGAAPPPPSGK